MRAANYDMPGMRKELIAILASGLKSSSKFYKEDYESIVRATNRKTRKELIEALNRHRAVSGVTQPEIKRNCQF